MSKKVTRENLAKVKEVLSKKAKEVGSKVANAVAEEAKPSVNTQTSEDKDKPSSEDKDTDKQSSTSTFNAIANAFKSAKSGSVETAYQVVHEKLKCPHCGATGDKKFRHISKIGIGNIFYCGECGAWLGIINNKRSIK